MNRVLLSYVGVVSLVAGCTSSSELATRDAGHPVPAVESGAPRMLHFNGETVAQAAEEFNRYNRRKIVVDDPAIAGLKVGGSFATTDPESFVTALEKTMGIKATTLAGEEGRDSGTIRLTGADTGR